MIAGAIAALELDDVDEAYRALVTAWQHDRSEAIAAAATEVHRAAAKRPPIDGAQWRARWHAIHACEDRQAAICSDAELSARLGCAIAWR
ncbi:MAG: hypothetical protein ABI678_25235 [Kofleriaceae bacterium]